MQRLENLDYCINYLMQQQEAVAAVPASLKGKQQLLYTLMSIWQPQPLDERYLAAQDSELREQLNDKGIVHRTGQVWRGDITTLEVDALVCSTDSHALGCWHPQGKGVADAVHHAAGLQLRNECARILHGDEIATGGAIITPGYNLPAKYVIHTCGPVVADGGAAGATRPTAGQERQLAACYHSALALARDFECRSIAFCCISTGAGRFPARRAAEIAVRACRDARLRVVFATHTHQDYDAYCSLLNTRQ